MCRGPGPVFMKKGDVLILTWSSGYSPWSNAGVRWNSIQIRESITQIMRDVYGGKVRWSWCICSCPAFFVRYKMIESSCSSRESNLVLSELFFSYRAVEMNLIRALLYTLINLCYAMNWGLIVEETLPFVHDLLNDVGVLWTNDLPFFLSHDFMGEELLNVPSNIRETGCMLNLCEFQTRSETGKCYHWIFLMMTIWILKMQPTSCTTIILKIWK